MEALEREKEPHSVGAGDYAEADEKGRDRLLVERVETSSVTRLRNSSRLTKAHAS